MSYESIEEIGRANKIHEAINKRKSEQEETFPQDDIDVFMNKINELSTNEDY